MSYTDRPDPPHPEGLVPIIGVLCILAAAVLGIAYCGCSEPPSKVPAYCTDEVAFTARLVACVEQSSSRALSRECRAAVHERCGIVMVASDGGAP